MLHHDGLGQLESASFDVASALLRLIHVGRYKVLHSVRHSFDGSELGHVGCIHSARQLLDLLGIRSSGCGNFI